MSNKRLKCDKCKSDLVKVRDVIKQSGYKYYFECPNCSKEYGKNPLTSDSWVNKSITTEYVAWDETQANIIGRYHSYKDAKQAILDYAKTLNKEKP